MSSIAQSFNHDVFQMTPLNRQEDDDSYSLTDGRVTLKLMPWRITDYDGVDANRPMLDHIGFRVEDADKVHDEIVDYVGQYPAVECAVLAARHAQEGPPAGRDA